MIDYKKLKNLLQIIDELRRKASSMYNIESAEEFEKRFFSLALQIERLADNARRAAIINMNIDRNIYLAALSDNLGITVEQDGADIRITLPFLLPKNKSINSDQFIIEPLTYSLQRFVDKYAPKKIRNPLITIRSIYPSDNPKLIRDTDNVEIHHTINIISTMLLVDDNMMDILLCSRIGPHPHTEIIVSKKNECEQ